MSQTKLPSAKEILEDMYDEGFIVSSEIALVLADHIDSKQSMDFNHYLKTVVDKYFERFVTTVPEGWHIDEFLTQKQTSRRNAVVKLFLKAVVDEIKRLPGSGFMEL